MKIKNVSISLVESNGELQAWGGTFTFTGSLPRNPDGSINEKLRKAKAKKLAQFLEGIELPEDF